MSDMLVKLYDLPQTDIFAKIRDQNVTLRPAMAPEKHLVCAWVNKHFNQDWVSEVEVAFSRQPVSVYIAVNEDNKMLGFACYDTTARGFFGPTGVDEAERGKGIGEALLLKCLHTMRVIGYGYAIIGWAGPTGFYAKKIGATIIEGSEPGIYKGLIKG
ncbi:MAG: GNAT family N-acetyltransferase [Alphaproteobacteria bacterium]|nr:GNAT family N-acetyltransferase [Alphaproteobacteria bacterium]